VKTRETPRPGQLGGRNAAATAAPRVTTASVTSGCRFTLSSQLFPLPGPGDRLRTGTVQGVRLTLV
jgi:hypothetical protein